MRICILTIGTRGDVQPYIALGMGLKAAGNEVTLGTLAEFRSLVESYGLTFAALRGDFLEAARTRESEKGLKNPLSMISQYVEMARDTLVDEWAVAQECDVLVYNPAALGGYHIAERLGVPAFAAFPAPMYSPTRAFPSPFLPFVDLGPLNKWSHEFFATMGPALYKRPINEWRHDSLGLPAAQGETALDGKPVTKLYCYSEAVVPRPADWDESSIVTGYWNVDAPSGWQPDPGLVAFLTDSAPPVYIGFGSMFMSSGEEKNDAVLEALRRTGQRAVLATGWGGLAANEATDNVFVLGDVPHDWLFPQVAATVHHGGAGTTGAALRAGIPTIICPFIGDQPFWGRRVEALGAGPAPIPQRRLNADRLARAIDQAVNDSRMKDKAGELGATLRAENGIGKAVDVILRAVTS